MVMEICTHKLYNIRRNEKTFATDNTDTADDCQKEILECSMQTKPSPEQLFVSNADSPQIISFHVHFSGYYSCVT